MATVLVLGGSGFFGKNFVDSFLEGALSPFGMKELVLASRSNPKADNTVFSPQNIKYEKLDLRTTEHLPDADYIFHFAASGQESDYLTDAGAQFDNIYRNVENFAEIIRRTNFSGKIVFASSGAVYGPQFEKKWLSESDLPSQFEKFPKNKLVYAEAKLEAEKVIRRLGEEGYDCAIARCFAFVGKHLPLDGHYAVGNFMQNILSGNPIRLRASKVVYRSYLHADELVKWLCTIASKASSDCPVYNVGSDDAISLLKLVQTLSLEYDKEFIVENDQMDDIDAYIPSVQKAREELGLEPSLGSIEAVKMSIAQLRRLT